MSHFILKFYVTVFLNAIIKRTMKAIKIKTETEHGIMQTQSMQHHAASCSIMQTDGGWRHLRPVWSRPPWGRREWSPRPRCWAASWTPSSTLSGPPWGCWCGPSWSAEGKTYPAAKSKYGDDKKCQTWQKKIRKIKELSVKHRPQDKSFHRNPQSFLVLKEVKSAACGWDTNSMTKVLGKVKSIVLFQSSLWNVSSLASDGYLRPWRGQPLSNLTKRSLLPQHLSSYRSRGTLFWSLALQPSGCSFGSNPLTGDGICLSKLGKIKIKWNNFNKNKNFTRVNMRHLPRASIWWAARAPRVSCDPPCRDSWSSLEVHSDTWNKIFLENFIHI